MRLATTWFLTALLPLVSWAQPAEQWVSGALRSQYGVNCAIVGSPYVEAMLTSTASWVRRVDGSAPKTGDYGYMALVISIPGLNCDANSAVAFEPAVELPPGAELAIAPTRPVRCFHTLNNNTITFTGTQLGIVSNGLRVGPVCPDGLGGGVGSPFLVGSATALQGGLSLGPQYLVRGTLLEVHLPVRYTRALSAPADQLRFTTRGISTLGTGTDASGNLTGPGTVAHTVGITVPYRPLFQALQASGVTATGASVGGQVSHFHAAGTVHVDWGANTAYGNTASLGAVAAADEVTAVSTSLGGLAGGSTVHWRLRLVTTLGSFVSPDQTFVTPGAVATLTVSTAGSGSGSVTSTPAGIACGSSCSSAFAAGSGVSLTASAAAGSAFAGWSGACSGSGGCQLTMSTARSVTATFNLMPSGPQTLTVQRVGAGVVTSQPAGISCGSTCTGSFAPGSVVTLSAAPSAQSVFDRFSGCSGVVGASVCTVTMDRPRVVGATFLPGLGFGSITMQTTGLPAGAVAVLRLDGPLGVSLQRSLPAGAGLSLSDVAPGSYTLAAPSVLAGGATYNPSPPSQTLNVAVGGTAAASVSFAPAGAGVNALTVARSGVGSGAVRSQPAGIDCGTTCNAAFGAGATVVLDPLPAAGSAFLGWTGSCSGAAACRLTMSQARSVTASFGQAAPTLEVARSAASPADGSRLRGQVGVPMLAFTLTPSQATQLQTVTLQAGGTGQDAADLLDVRLVADANANGLADPGEAVLASGRFSTDDGSLTLTVGTPPAIGPGASAYVVAVDLAQTLAAARPTGSGVPVWAWLGPLPLLGVRRRARPWLRRAALALALAGTACGPLSPLILTVVRSYQLTLSSVGASNMPVVTGLPLAGATISVLP